MLSSIGKRIRRAHSHRCDKNEFVESAIDRIAMDAALSRRCRGETHTIKAGIVTSSEVAP
jgi:hypothetical protein